MDEIRLDHDRQVDSLVDAERNRLSVCDIASLAQPFQKSPVEKGAVANLHDVHASANRSLEKVAEVRANRRDEVEMPLIRPQLDGR
jgi:hypothetical protein